jgi:hypothetical protein
VRGVALGLALLVVLAPFGRTASGSDRLDRVSAGLASDQLFVDPDVSTLLDATARKAIETKIHTAKFPVYVVAMPLDSDDESGGDRSEFAWKLHQRFGRPGEYVIIDQNSDIDTLEFGVPTSFRSFQLNVDLMDGNSPLPVRLHAILDQIIRAPAAPPDTPDEPEPPTRVYDRPFAGHHGSRVGAFLGGLAGGTIGAGILTLLIVGLVRRVRRLVVRRRLRPHGQRPRSAELAKTAEHDLARLRTELAVEDDNPGRPRALSALDAAEILHGERHDPVDLLGVSVLARDGLAALSERTRTPGRLCFVNPWHGAATTTTKVRLPDLTTTRHPICASCLPLTDTERSAAVLRLPGGRPYYALPGLWHDAALTGTEPDLPQRVREYLGVED